MRTFYWKPVHRNSGSCSGQCFTAVERMSRHFLRPEKQWETWVSLSHHPVICIWNHSQSSSAKNAGFLALSVCFWLSEWTTESVRVDMRSQSSFHCGSAAEAEQLTVHCRSEAQMSKISQEHCQELCQERQERKVCEWRMPVSILWKKSWEMKWLMNSQAFSTSGNVFPRCLALRLSQWFC